MKARQSPRGMAAKLIAMSIEVNETRFLFLIQDWSKLSPPVAALDEDFAVPLLAPLWMPWRHKMAVGENIEGD
jgi:hypothetical protein